jgi:Ca2+-binding EF-hand superfamily protein
MKKTDKIAALAAFIALTASVGHADTKGHKAPKEITRAEAIEKAGERFDRADTNGDGVLTAEEMRASMKKMRDGKKGDRKGPRDHFEKIDSDKSGAISLEEFKAAADKMRKRKPEGDTKRGDKFSEKVFQHLDTDESGDLSKDELKAGKRKGKHDGPKKGHRYTDNE